MLDAVNIDKMEALRLATTQMKCFDTMCCMNVKFSGVNSHLIEEKLAAKDVNFFQTAYLTFITSPEELGVAFQAGGINLTQLIDFAMIDKVNHFIMELDADNKAIMVSELDRLMVI